MPWIPVIHEHEARGPLKEIYAQRMDSAGRVPAVVKASCWNVPYLRARSDFFRALMYRSEGLSRAEREFIGVVTAVVSRCEY